MANSVERYYIKKKKRKKRAKMIFFGLLFIFMLITLAILSMTVFFNAEKIEVEGATHYSIEEILETGGLKIGQNLFRLDKFKVIDKMETLPYVKSVKIDRKLPSTLKVEITENQPVVWLKGKGGAALLNEEYRVLELLELPENMLPKRPSAAITLEKQAQAEKEKAEKEEKKEGEEAQEETPAEEPAEQPPEKEEAEKEEAGKEESEKEETPVFSQLAELPQLIGVEADALEIGKEATFGETDFSGFLLALYEGFSRDAELQWILVDEVQFNARFDVKVVYDDRIVIDFGTLDQVEKKVELASYMLKENSTMQAAVLDVSNPERVYYRPLNKQ